MNQAMRDAGRPFFPAEVSGDAREMTNQTRAFFDRPPNWPTIGMSRSHVRPTRPSSYLQMSLKSCKRRAGRPKEEWEESDNEAFGDLEWKEFDISVFNDH